MFNDPHKWSKTAANAAAFLIVGAFGAILYYVGWAAIRRLPTFAVREES